MLGAQTNPYDLECLHNIAAYQHMTGTQVEHTIADLARRDPSVRAATVSGGANERALDVLLHLGRRTPHRRPGQALRAIEPRTRTRHLRRGRHHPRLPPL
ncbi:hypothetical protein ACIRPT_39380 [Streptomyces sp. NPDC101227]|uniref:hypothetical protein n=1 Tax=Streptomyces sp. NPDC101227 TaxID=3366136 RepID=UPI0037FF2A89